MTTHIPQVAGTNLDIGSFQPKLLNYDSRPLVCSVTTWWLSVKVCALSYILLLSF